LVFWREREIEGERERKRERERERERERKCAVFNYLVMFEYQKEYRAGLKQHVQPFNNAY
jgi:hypothetical protein